MKWTLLAGVVALTTGCCTTTEVVQYRQVGVVRVAPIVRPVVVRPVVTRVVEPVLVDYVEPIDVTTTTIDFY